MDLLSDLTVGLAIEPTVILDILLTAVLIYGVLSLIQGTRAVRLVIGAIILYLVYMTALELELNLLSGILQTFAVVGLVALVVIFQPELRRGLDRLGRVGSWGWLGTSDMAAYQRIAGILAASAAKLSRRHTGAVIVIERDTPLGDMAETGVMLHADLSAELLASLFAPGYPLHDGAVIVGGDKVIAAGVMLPLAERDASLEHYGTRHRAALGITEQTDALAIVVSEESGVISLAEAGAIVSDLDEDDLRQRLYGLLSPTEVARRARSMASWGSDGGGDGGTEAPPAVPDATDSSAAPEGESSERAGAADPAASSPGTASSRR